MPTHWNVLFFSIYILFNGRSALSARSPSSLMLMLQSSLAWARASARGDEKFLHPYPHVASFEITFKEISSGLLCVLRILTHFIFDGIVWTVLFALPRGPLHAFLSQRPASAVIFIVLTLIITLLDRNLAFRLCGPSRTFK
jgi:hypothetical protein